MYFTQKYCQAFLLHQSLCYTSHSHLKFTWNPVFAEIQSTSLKIANSLCFWKYSSVLYAHTQLVFYQLGSVLTDLDNCFLTNFRMCEASQQRKLIDSDVWMARKSKCWNLLKTSICLQFIINSYWWKIVVS